MMYDLPTNTQRLCALLFALAMILMAQPLGA